MRDLARSGRMPEMARLSLAICTLLAGCHSPEYLLWQAEQEQYASTGSSGDLPTTTDDAGPASTGGPLDSGGGTSSSSATTGGEPPSETDTEDATDTAGSPPVGEAEKPSIVSVELPAKVHAAGPVPLAVQTENTVSVQVMLDGADAGDLIAAGDGLFTGALPVRGAIDNGSHEIEVIARQGKYEARRPGFYEVSTPAPGTEAWSQTGPAISRTNRIAVTPEGDLIEVGQTVIAGVPRPTIRKRSGVTGAELWSITLDPREGAVADVAVLPDGRMWVAMNVREPNKDSRARIALLDEDGQPGGIEALGTVGRVVRALAADAEGGCFAVGVAGVMGDWDIAYWRVTAAGVQTLGDTYDYVPPPQPEHSFVDLANDVVIDGDVAWVVGISTGKHDAELNITSKYVRGILVPMNLHTGKLAGSVIVALPADLWPQSAFFGAAFSPEGVVVTGYGCDKTCAKYRIETARYTADGERTWFAHETANNGLAYGSDVALDSQSRALVAGAATQNGKLRGYVFGRKVSDDGGPFSFDHWYPGVGPSEALGIVLDTFDRIFPAGYLTINGEPQAWITLFHG